MKKEKQNQLEDFRETLIEVFTIETKRGKILTIHPDQEMNNRYCLEKIVITNCADGDTGRVIFDQDIMINGRYYPIKRNPKNYDRDIAAIIFDQTNIFKGAVFHLPAHTNVKIEFNYKEKEINN